MAKVAVSSAELLSRPDLLMISATTCDWPDFCFNLHLTRAGETYYTRKHLDFRCKKEDLEAQALLFTASRTTAGPIPYSTPFYKWWRFHSKKKRRPEGCTVAKLLDWPFA